MSDTESNLLHLSEENELLLQQLHQVQEELEHYLQLNDAYARQHADLKRQLEATSFAPETVTFTQKLSDAIGLSNHVAKLALRNEIKASGLFDEKWYLEQYKDVAAEGCDPLDHFLQFGAKEMRNPGPGFDSHWYLTTYPDVAAKGINPLEHFICYGKSEGRQPCPESADAGKDPIALERQWLQQARDEQAQLARERAEQVETLSKALAKLEEEKSVLAGRHDEQAQLARERQGQVAELTQALAKLEEEKSVLAGRQAEAERLAAERLGQINELQQQIQTHQQLSQEEKVRAEAQLNLIKDMLTRDAVL